MPRVPWMPHALPFQPDALPLDLTRPVTGIRLRPSDWGAVGIHYLGAYLQMVGRAVICTYLPVPHLQ